jgi:hypothetical protein
MFSGQVYPTSLAIASGVDLADVAVHLLPGLPSAITSTGIASRCCAQRVLEVGSS